MATTHAITVYSIHHNLPDALAAALAHHTATGQPVNVWERGETAITTPLIYENDAAAEAAGFEHVSTVWAGVASNSVNILRGEN